MRGHARSRSVPTAAPPPPGTGDMVAGNVKDRQSQFGRKRPVWQEEESDLFGKHQPSRHLQSHFWAFRASSTGMLAYAQEDLFTVRTLRHVSLFLLSACLTSASNLFAPLSKNDEGDYEYSTGAAVCFAELVKLTLSLCMWIYEYWFRRLRTTPPPEGEPLLIAADPFRQVALYSIPALLWFANNNIVVCRMQARSRPLRTAHSDASARLALATVLRCAGHLALDEPGDWAVEDGLHCLAPVGSDGAALQLAAASRSCRADRFAGDRCDRG